MGVGTAVVCHAEMLSCAIWMLSVFVKALVQQTHSQSWDAQCCNVECNSIEGWLAQGIKVNLRHKTLIQNRKQQDMCQSLGCMLLRVQAASFADLCPSMLSPAAKRRSVLMLK